ncbi:uncharacterized protein [Blastocystis hominis]|uniref:Uncharacterized protein n=1 Tax=Blastocystis hominis TaxID=12968 RepID=D8LYW1_BLAHO|nr:uncharacterized protein [Blastocystis hominis]CBK21000.2 unnamed protein product [Blastocystis hominis]|eukprot:XP_012895048.1 uncharacterized protein [Blastocystis hominis]
MSCGIGNFNYANPTRILFGRGQIAQLPNLIDKDRLVFMTYGGGSIKRNGVYDQVMKALEGYEIIEFGGIEANPDFDTLVKAVDQIRKLDMSRVFLLAVGGGSVADGTKFIAAACQYTKSEDLWELVLSAGAGVEVAIPMGCVMTLPATGSESNWGAVISRRALNCKYSIYSPLLFPQWSILDPDTTMSLPLRQTINGVIDSIVHVCEQYLTTCTHADVQDRYAEALLLVLMENGRKVIASPSDYAARANIMWASTQALNRWICQGVQDDWATHKIGHELTAFLGMDHARTLACIQPRVLEFQFEAKKGKLAQMGRRVFGIQEGTEEEIARKAIEALVRFYEEDMGMKTHIREFDQREDRSWIDRVVEK